MPPLAPLGLSHDKRGCTWTRAGRDELRRWAAGLGVPLRLYALDCPPQEAWRRVRRRTREPGALLITRETFELFLARFESLGPDEAREQVS